jgi:hypothetical protein
MPLTESDRLLLKDFYAALAMTDIREEPGGVYSLPREVTDHSVFRGCTRRIKANVSLNQVAADEYGGKVVGMKLLRHVSIASKACHDGPEGRRVFDLIGPHFLRVVERWPLVRSYYEMARIGATQHTWHRNTQR